MKDEVLIEALNTLINEAVCDGGDGGGPYHQNEHDLVEAMNNILDILGLQDKYEVAKYEDETYWSDYYIRRKKEN